MKTKKARGIAALVVATVAWGTAMTLGLLAVGEPLPFALGLPIGIVAGVTVVCYLTFKTLKWIDKGEES